jgi:dTDP-4-amino-4,6-dideoxygalactose transaminase
VVIDGAASLERLSDEPRRLIGDVPVSLSFHATKTFATGEGGAVVTADPQRARLVTEALNFGFFANRESRAASTNGKMSEYHAAVGLAELEGWHSKRLAFEAVADRYRQRLDSIGLGNRCVASPTVAGCYVLFRCGNVPEAGRVRESLTLGKIEFRLWYGNGLHTQPHFHDLSRDSLDVTERLAPVVIGLPSAVDLSDAAIERVVLALELGVNER